MLTLERAASGGTCGLMESVRIVGWGGEGGNELSTLLVLRGNMVLDGTEQVSKMIGGSEGLGALHMQRELKRPEGHFTRDPTEGLQSCWPGWQQSGTMGENLVRCRTFFFLCDPTSLKRDLWISMRSCALLCLQLSRAMAIPTASWCWSSAGVCWS